MGKMEGQGEMGYYGEEFMNQNNNIIMGGGEREDSTTGSENFDTLSVEENLEAPPPPPPPHNEGASSTKKPNKRKRYHRHTPQQIQELENFYKSNAHPDEKQRLELGKRLNLESRQVKFWFQNRRTQMKTQVERHENVVLKQEYDKLRVENIALKDAIRNPICQNCGGTAILGEISMDETPIRLENEQLKDELIRVSVIAERFIGKPVSELANQIANAAAATATLQMSSMGRAGLTSVMPMRGHGLGNGVSMSNPSIVTSSMNGSMMTSEYEKTVFMQTAISAIDGLLAMAQGESPFWFKVMDTSREMLNHEAYAKKFSPFVAISNCGFLTDATRESGSVFISSLDLVETMMSPNRWKAMFPCIIGNAATVEVLFHGANGTRDGELQLMNAEFVYPSPCVALRQEKILRFCKQHSEGTWVVVDVSVDMIRESSSFSGSIPNVKWRRLPSGCIIQDVSNGYSLVTWIEHSEYDENFIHLLYRPLMRSGLAFGAQRWLATLQRERECAAIMATGRAPEVGAMTQEGKRSILKLMVRISNNFCSGLCPSSSRLWEKLQIRGLAADVSIMSRVSINEPGEPSGVVLSASTSVWLPVPREHLFEFLRDEKLRGKWDILANGGPMEVVARVAKSHDGNNCISVLCPPAAPPRECNMLIMQESWTDKTGSFIVYAPVDSASVDTVLRGGDSDYLALLPSGFAIADGPIHPNVPEVANNGVVGPGGATTGASVLTLGFQILVSSLPTAKLTVESIDTVNNLMSCTIQKISASLGA